MQPKLGNTKLCALILCMLFSNVLLINLVHAEGTPQIAPTNTDTVSIFINSENYYNFARYGSIDSERLYIHIANPASEQVFLGFSQPVEDGHLRGDTRVEGYFRIVDPNGTVVFGPHLLDEFTSNITSYAETVAGPAPIAGASGYTPFTFDPSGLDAGDYYVEFSTEEESDSGDEFVITYFDITVATNTNSTPVAQNGRVFSKNWAFFLPSISKGTDPIYSWFDRPFQGKLYPYTEDGFVSDIDFLNSGFQPAAFNISLNDAGTGTSGNVIEDRKSLNSGQGNTVQYKIFLNNPDEAVYPSGVFGSLLTDSTQLIGCPDIGYRFRIMTTQEGVIEFLLDQDQATGVGVYDPGTADRIFAVDVNEQLTDDTPNLFTRYIDWDGLDGLGNPIDPTSVAVPTEVTFSQGRYHIPVYDAEFNLNGFSSTIIRPTPPSGYVLRYYWDDSNIPDDPVVAGQSNINGEGCVPGCHQWTVSDYGNVNTINTYWYAKQEFQADNLTLINDCGEDTDGDGTYDAVDIDWDNDGIPNHLENCIVADPNCSGQDPTIDSDDDGILNYLDEDFCTLNSFGICSALDPDNDGIPSFLDLDADNDGIPDIIEAGGTDTDGNGIADDLTDADNDGLVDTYDSIDDSGAGTPTTVSVSDECVNVSQPSHTISFNSVITDALNDVTFTFILEGDYGADFETFALTGEGGVVIASDQNRQNSDNNAYGDCDDPGMNFTYTITQALWNEWNNDGIVSLLIQADVNVGAGVCIGLSSCISTVEATYNIPPAGAGTDIANADTDSDGIFDFLDLDSDNDGLADLVEVGGVDVDGNGMADDMTNPATGDTNNDGWSDAITASVLVDTNLDDDNIDFDLDTNANHLDIDSDNDGITDVIESNGEDGNGDGMADDNTGTITDTNFDGWDDNYDDGTIITNVDGLDANSIADFETGRDEPDFDADGLPNWLDIDADDDGIVDNTEGQATDAYVAPTTDSDNDGLNDAYEIAGTIGSFGGVGIDPENTDGFADGDDYLDLNTDNDNEEDTVEAHDTDGSGVVDGSDAPVANTGIATGVDSDGDGLDDGFDNVTTGVSAKDPTNVNLEPSSHVNVDDNTTPERDWREVIDIDLDDDGITNADEDGGTGFDPTGDEDGDDIPNFQDDTEATVGFPAFTDTNGDGVNDVYDTDLDGIPDFADLDADNDGIQDIIEAGGVDTDNDGLADDLTDEDNDGLADIYDSACESAPAVPCSNAGVDIPNEDTDSDGRPDYIDLDSDNDGIADLVEVGGQDTDGNGMADDMANLSTGDTNLDGWSDTFTANPLVEDDLNDSTIDFDGDNHPNHLDIDSDNDGITDVIESGGQDGNGDGMADDGAVAGTRVDANNDGWEDNYDDGIITTNADGVDANTIADFATGANNPDVDADGQPNWLDIDADDDGIVDNSEGQATLSYVPPTTDSDNDGLNDAYEIAGTIGSFGGVGIDPENTDGASDGADYLDTDADNDLESDNIEGHDTNGDGVVDASDDPSNNANTGIYIGTDADLDGLDDGYDNNIGSLDPTDGGLTPNSYTDFDDIGTAERDWRETSDIDLDDDGIPNLAEDGGTGFDPIGDADGDGTPNFQDASDVTGGFPTFVDSNGDNINDVYDADLDGIPDYIDLDADNDGIPDIVEAGGIDTNGDGRVDDNTDTDGDGLADDYDSVCVIGSCTPATTGEDIPNLDVDSDGMNDYIDIDADNDGIPDIIEVGGADVDNDGQVDVSLDEDGDGLADIYDQNASDGGGSGTNGTALVDTDNSGNWLDVDGDSFDADGDGFVDGLDLDADNDGIPDVVEAGGDDTNGDGRVDDLTDTDGDGLADTYDSDCTLAACSPGTTGTDIPNEDNDGDGIVDYLDLDADNDGIPDIVEGGGIDTNGDGRVDVNLDADDDGLADVFDENASDGPGTAGVDGTALIETDGSGVWIDGMTGGSKDVDGDGHTDGLDLDADNDGIPDIIEAGGTDDEGDGVVDTQALPWDADEDGLADIFDENASDGPGGNGANGTALVETNADTNTDGRVNTVNESMVPGGSNIVNADTDNIPNHLDLDADNDGIVDILEAGGVDINGNGLVDDFNPGSPSTFDTNDNDGWSPTFDGDAANDGALTTVGDGTPMIETQDTNFDGIPENYTLGDTDLDAHPDFLDIDADDDGIVDNIEAQNTPGYTLPDNLDGDNDGLDDAYDNFVGFGGTGIETDAGDSEGTPYDHDSDGTPDYLDWDSDGDNIADQQEAWDGLLDGDSQVDPSIGTCDGSDIDNDGLEDCFDSDTTSPMVTSYNTPIDDNGTEGAGTGASTPISGNDPSDIFPNNDAGDGQPDFRDILIDCATPQVYYAISEQSVGTGTDYEYNGTAHENMADTKVVRATAYCTPGDGWFYFYNPLEPENYLFALKNSTGSPNTVPMHELVDFIEIKVESDATNRHVIGNTSANLVMERDWRVEFKNTPTTGSTFDIKFYFQPAEMTALKDAADEAEANAVGNVVREFYWFKKEDGLQNSDITTTSVEDMQDITSMDPNDVSDTQSGNTDGTNLTTGNGRNYVTLEGLSGFSGGTGGIKLTYAALPVELARFTANTVDCAVELDWVSASEESFSHYELERSIDGRRFEQIAEIAGQGIEGVAEYNFKDTDAKIENYYRLKMVDLDGSFEYSNIEIVTLDCEESNINLYPNPAKDQDLVTVEYKNIQGLVNVSIFDVAGKRVKVIENQVDNDQATLDVSDLSQGTYLIQFYYNGRVEGLKFVKLK